MKHKYTPTAAATLTVRPSWIDNFQQGKYVHYILIALMLVILISAFPKIALLHYVPQNAHDTSSWRGAAEVQVEYNKTHKDQALWNSNIFSGMPGYLISFAPKYPFIDNLRNVVSHVIDWRIFLMFLGGVGMYILMLSWEFEPVVAFIAGISFALSCHFTGLLDIGHNTKFRAIMYIPWMVWAFTYLRRHRDLFGLGALTVLAIGQLRENHPQISYYTFIILSIFWIVDLVSSLRNRDLKKFLVFTLLLILAVGIAAMAVAQPYMSIKEYSQYTIRGGVDGVGKDYAEKWSFHPLEILSFFAPDFFGGVSPTYWGWQPWSQVYHYMGVIVLLLAFFGLFWARNKFILPLGLTALASLLFSFGQHFDSFSTFLLKYLPYYNKFRAPVTSLVMLQFATVALSAFGLQMLLSRIKAGDPRLPKILRILVIVFAIVLVVFPMTNAAWKSTGMAKHIEKGDQPEKPEQALGQMQLTNEQIQAYIDQYGRDWQSVLAHIRIGKMQTSVATSCVFILLFLALAWMASRQRIGKSTFLILIVIMILVDLLMVDKRFLKDVAPSSEIAQQYEKTDIDNYLLNDMQKNHDVFRVFPVTGLGDNTWTYYHQSIGGYHASKLKRYEDLRSNCLLISDISGNRKVNWNVVDMLNVKYVVYSQPIGENLTPVLSAGNMNQPSNLYLNNTCLPRAWLVDSLDVVSDPAKIQQRLNDPRFNPRTTAIVESAVTGCAAPDSAASKVTMTNWELQKLDFSVETDKQAFMVVSEVYYPAGWNAYIDGKPAPILPTNYVLRGVVVPAGKHTVEMRFEPKTYYTSLKLSFIGLLAALLLTLIGAWLWVRKNYQGKIIYVIKGH